MKKNSNESKIITGVAWYRPEQWERLREVSEDVDNLEETYEAWLKTAEHLIRDDIPFHFSRARDHPFRGVWPHPPVECRYAGMILDGCPRL